MRFAEPHLLHLLWAVPALLALALWAARRRRGALARLGDRGLLLRLSPGRSGDRRFLRHTLGVAALLFSVIALARPQWGATEEVVRRRGLDVMLLLDTSRSMLAEDVRPNRLGRAVLELRSFIDRDPGDRLGLVVFASSAHTVCPLTLDGRALGLFLTAVDAEVTSNRGTALGEAIREALRGFEGEGERARVILLVSDGEDQGSDLEGALAEASERGVLIHAIGVGSPTGEPIPERGPGGELLGYQRDGSGRVVSTKLVEDTLRETAQRTGGSFRRLTEPGAAAEGVLRDVERLEKAEFESRVARASEERFQIPLLAALLLLLARQFLPEGRKAEPVPRREAA